MVIGDDKAVLVCNKSRSEASLFEILFRDLPKKPVEELLEAVVLAKWPLKMFEYSPPTLYGPDCSNIDHCGAGCLCEFGKVCRNHHSPESRSSL